MIDATTTGDQRRLDSFLAPTSTGATTTAFVPRFTDGHTSQSDGRNIQYRGGLFADADVRALLNIQQLCNQTTPPTRLTVRYDTDFELETAAGNGGFVIGSNTNDATDRLISGSNASEYFGFEFGETWAIDWADGQRNELPDPSNLEPGEYASTTDFGVLARATLWGTESRLFLIAGLGSRATAAASHYLLNRWTELAARFNGDDFVVLVACEADASPLNYRIQRSHRLG